MGYVERGGEGEVFGDKHDPGGWLHKVMLHESWESYRMYGGIGQR